MGTLSELLWDPLCDNSKFVGALNFSGRAFTCCGTCDPYFALFYHMLFKELKSDIFEISDFEAFD